MTSRISNIRKDYTKDTIKLNDLDINPIYQFKKWFDNALKSNVLEANAMVLSTVTPEGMPQGRVLLLKDIDENGFTFFSNYNSSKGKDLSSNSMASMTFFWPELEQQIRISGSVDKIKYETSKAYFESRPRGSQISALASPQSQVIKSRGSLSKEVERLERTYEGKDIPMPSSWGGYLLKPVKIEFWQGRSSRLHDRFLYEKINEGWRILQLAP